MVIHLQMRNGGGGSCGVAVVCGGEGFFRSGFGQICLWVGAKSRSRQSKKGHGDQYAGEFEILGLSIFYFFFRVSIQFLHWMSILRVLVQLSRVLMASVTSCQCFFLRLLRERSRKLSPQASMRAEVASRSSSSLLRMAMDREGQGSAPSGVGLETGIWWRRWHRLRP